MEWARYDGFDLTQRTIFGLLSRNLFGVDYRLEKGVDWEEVVSESKDQAVFQQVFADLREIPGCPGELQDMIKVMLVKNMMKNAAVHAQHSYIHRLLTSHGISYVVLKGAVSAQYYPDPQSRAMGDVDIYVDQIDFARTLDVFEKEGFEASNLEHDCHIVLRKGKVYVELHFMLAGVPDGVLGEIVNGYLTDLVSEAVLMKNTLVTCVCPTEFYHGLIMLMHLQHHLVAEGVGLRHLCDWAVFVEKFSDDKFLALFGERLKKLGLWHLARLLSLTAVRYLGLPEQSWMREREDDDEVVSALMWDIVGGGNFGKKDSQRFYEGFFISNRGKDGIQNRRIRKAIEAINRIVCQKYPFVNRYPLLLPIGWIRFLWGYLKRRKRRETRGKNICFWEAYQKSAQRIKLYQRLRLYEPEK